jgi:hypothetical protein
MKKKNPFLGFVIAFATIFISGFGFIAPAHGFIDLLDGNLRVDGFYKEYMFIRTHIPADEQKFHGSNLDQALSSFLVEGLWKVKQDPSQTLNLFAGFRYWYEKASYFDYKLNRAIPSHEVSRYQHPQNEKDIITEAYLDYIRGPFNVRIGKQIVIWGETDIKRTVDVVNPLDLRYGSPGVFSWAELKQGLWMFRGFYQSQLPGNLLFEFVYNPGYYQALRLPVEGTHWGPSPSKTNPVTYEPFGIYHWTVTKKWKDDAPKKWAIDNWELGIRLRGFSYNVDWTLVYYNSQQDAPVVTDPDALLTYSGAYFASAFRSKDTGESIHPKDPGVKVYDTKRYQLFGGTMQTAIDFLHGSIWRLEWFYEYGAYYNKGTGASTSAIYDKVKRDTFGFGLNYSDKFDIPYITRHWFNNQYFQVSLTAFYEKILNNSRDLIVSSDRDHRLFHSHSSSIAWNLMQFWNNNIWAFVFTGSWAPEINKGFAAPMLAYAPGQHWRFEGGPVIYWSGYAYNRGYYDKDSILIRLRYEF